ncbi:MAG TPA: competence protein CoiA family protein, partial [Gemmatimonadaceae bacterium]|nr:competence protein CoiA family protein [Gemmatimonadaceae bacterium]
LAWILVDERIAPVSSFAHLPPRARPRVRCPLCRGPVVLKLGPRRAHHAAHVGDAGCPVLHGETALHVNTKCHLAHALEHCAHPRLHVRRRCGARMTEGDGRGHRCEAVEERAWVTDWDAVELELTLDGARPDITLLRAGRPIAAIEVVSTHAVSSTKAAVLAALGVPWVEVSARRDLYGGLVPWTASEPLEARRLGPGTDDLRPWRCRVHARRAAHPSRDGRVPWRARVVDRYLPDGRCVRDLLWLDAELRDGRVVAVRLLHQADDDVIAKSTTRSRNGVLRELHGAFLRWARRRAGAGERVDSPMPWVPATRLRREGGGRRLDVLAFPRRYRFVRGDGTAGTWVRVAWLAQRTWMEPDDGWRTAHE